MNRLVVKITIIIGKEFYRNTEDYDPWYIYLYYIARNNMFIANSVEK